MNKIINYTIPGYIDYYSDNNINNNNEEKNNTVNVIFEKCEGEVFKTFYSSG